MSTPEQRAEYNRRYNQTEHAKELSRVREAARRARTVRKPPKRPVVVVRAEFQHMLRQAAENRWSEQIRCLNKPEQYTDYPPAERPTALEAQLLCVGCPLIDLCLEYGKTERGADGVYGGVVFIDGKIRVEDVRDLAA